MNQNVIIGILVVLLLVGGGYYFFTMNAAPTGTTATTTPTTGTTGTNTTPTAGAPVVTTNTSVAPTNSTALVTGTVTPNGAQTTYWYEYGVSSTLGSKTSVETIGSGWSAIASPGYITGLRANTQYYFRLSAQNAYGVVTGATYSFSTNNNSAGQGSAPAANTNSASNITATSATLNAQVNPHSSQASFWFEYGDGTAFGNVTALQLAGNNNTLASVALQVSNLNPGTKYYFRVNAQNQYGTTNGATQSFTTAAAVAPVATPVVTTQVASPVGTTTATLRGTVNTNNTATTYWFEYSASSLLGSVAPKTTAHTSASGTGTISISANISGLQAGTLYYYRTVAQNASGTVRGDSLTITTK